MDGNIKLKYQGKTQAKAVELQAKTTTKRKKNLSLW